MYWTDTTLSTALGVLSVVDGSNTTTVGDLS